MFSIWDSASLYPKNIYCVNYSWLVPLNWLVAQLSHGLFPQVMDYIIYLYII